jgi:hypothetical protein
MRSWIALSLLAAGTALAQVEMTIAEAQIPGSFGPDSSGACTQLVTVTGLALSSTLQFYSGSHTSFYLIDAQGGDYSGILIYSPLSDAFDIAVGDSVRVTGVVSEYRTVDNATGRVSNMTELVPAAPDTDVEVLDYELVDHLPDPVFVDMWYLDPVRHNEHVGERYEGMLMEIHDAVVVDISAPPSFRQFTVADPQGNRTVIRTAAASLSNYGRPPLGSTFSMIRGVIYQVYGNYNVMPRDIDDLILAVGPPIISGTTFGPCGATSADLVHVATNLSDNTAIDEAFVYYRVGGGAFVEFPLTRDLSNPVLFTADLPAQPSGTLVEIYVYAMDDEGNPSYYPADGAQSAAFPQLYVTDEMPATCAQIQGQTYADGGSVFACHQATLSGVVTMGYDDFFHSGADSTYRNYIFADAAGMNNAIYIYNNTSHGVWMPDLQRGDQLTVTGEVTEYNGVTELSYISAFEVTGSGAPVVPTATTIAELLADPEPWESVLVQLGALTVVEDAGFGEWRAQDGDGQQIVIDNIGSWDVELHPGDTMDGLTGVVGYTFGAWKIAPRTNDDFLNLVEVGAPTQPARFRLVAAQPNPFNPATVLHYSLEQAAAARLAVYNLAGQEVAVLVDGRVPAGEHSAVLDGSALASGLYLARLEVGGRSSELKLTLLK